jgi:hypothetical protein
MCAAMTANPILLRVSAAPLIFIALVWSYLLQPIAVPISLPFLLQSLVTALFAAGAAWIFQGVAVELEMRPGDWAILAGLFSVFCLLNLPILRQSINGDEVYHASHAASLKVLAALAPETLKACAWVQRTPIPELNSWVSVIFIALVAASAFAFTRLEKRNLNAGWAAATIAVWIAGWVVLRSVAPDPHPPLRTLPLFMGQLFLGLHDISYRLPGIAAVTVTVYAAYRAILARLPGSRVFALLAASAIYFIPTVFHASVIVEPSIWAFVSGTLTILFADRALRKGRDSDWLFAGLVLGLGTLARQNTILFWPGFVLLVLFERRAIARPWLVLAPLLFILPYIGSLSRLGHPAANVRVAASEPAVTANPSAADVTPRALRELAPKPTESRGWPKPVRNLKRALTSGDADRLILHSSTWPWVLFLLLGMIVIFLRRRSPHYWFYLSVPAGIVLFFSIGPILWGLGRYQVEFIAPATALTIILLTSIVSPALRPAYLALLAVLSIYSVSTNATFHQDVYYQWWAQKRLSTESFYPYKAALGFLQRQSTGGRFLIMGGVPTYGSFLLWPRGYTLQDVAAYDAIDAAWTEEQSGITTAAAWHQFRRTHNVDYLVVSFGEKRGGQHRNPQTQALLDDLAKTQTPADGWGKLHTFYGDREGAIDIYGPIESRYRQ